MKGNEDNYPLAWEDALGEIHIGNSALEIILSMKRLEWGGPPPTALEFKQRISHRAAIFGKVFEFNDAFSFLLEMERHGIGRFRPDFVQNTAQTEDFSSQNL